MSGEERNRQDATNPKFLSVVCLNMLRGPLCPSSGEQDCAEPVQNRICGNAQSCSPEDGHNGARSMLRQTTERNFGLVASCRFISLPYVHDARSQKPKISFRSG